MKLFAHRLIVFAVLMLLYAWSPWVGVAALAVAVWYVSGQRARRADRLASHSSATAVTLIIGTLAGVALTAQSTGVSIREQIRETGMFERIVLTPYEVQLRDLVNRADLIVEASTAGGRSYVNPAESDIYTDYPFELHAVVKTSARSEVRAGDVVTVRRDSGMVLIEGRTAVSQENDFPLFVSGEQYVLFLVKLVDENVYQVYGGPQGAFTAAPVVRQLATQTGTWNSTRGAVPPALFFDEVRALLKGTRPPV